MRKAFEIGGILAAIVLVVFGVVAIAMGNNGRQTVNKSLQNEYIVGGSDMTPSAIRAEAQKAGIASAVKEWPTKSVANQKIDTGAKARLMAQYMHIHALEATQGFTYAQMGIYTAKPGTPKAQLMPGGGTENVAFAAVDPNTKQPLQNGLFGIVVGIALLLTGIGLGILAVGGALRNPETVLKSVRRPHAKTPAVPVA
jgi:F0F1-type ATP synthase membrane subunit c/vacuolar-type H+-ATPase subunit K